MLLKARQGAQKHFVNKDLVLSTILVAKKDLRV